MKSRTFYDCDYIELEHCATTFVLHDHAQGFPHNIHFLDETSSQMTHGRLHNTH